MCLCLLSWIKESKLDQRKQISTLPVQKRIGECSICLDDMFQTQVVALPCGHVYHQTCIDMWLLKCRSCPICGFNL